MRQSGQIEGARSGVQRRPEPTMHLAVVACGERLEETLTMIKSAVLFSVKRLYLHVFAEDQLHAGFVETVSYLPCYHREFSLFPLLIVSTLYRCVSAGVVARFVPLEVQLHRVLHQLPQRECRRVEEAL